MFPNNKNISNHMSDEKLFLFQMKKSESDVVDDLFLAIQNIVAGTAIVSNTVLSDTCFQYKIHLSNDSPQITLQYEMKLDEKELLVPVVKCKAVSENDKVDDDNNANKRNESLEITLPDRKEISFPMCCVKQEIPEMLSVLNDIENIDDKKLASIDNQTKVNHSEMNHYTKSASDPISNSDASESRLFALLVSNSHVITPVKEEKNGNIDRVVQNKRLEQMETNKINEHIERGAIIKKKYTGNCSYCGKLFKNKSSKKLHEKIHTGEKPFTCDECGRAFTESGSLQRHKRIHKHEKSLICNVCDEIVSCADLNDHHKKYHSGKSIFSCKHCDRSFAYSRSLSKHIKIHHPGKLYKCEECGAKFPRLHLLIYHKRIHV